MKRILMMLVVFGLVFSGCNNLEKHSITLLISGNNQGKLTPCGCKIPIGGLARKAAYIQKFQNENIPVILADGGNWLYPNVGNSDFIRKKLKNIATLQAKVYRDLGYDVVNIGTYDLKYGLETLKKFANDYNMPFISANIRDLNDITVFPGHRIVERNGLSIAFIGLCELNDTNGSDYQIADPVKALEREISAVVKNADYIIVLADGMEYLKERVKEEKMPVNLWIDSRNFGRSYALKSEDAFLSVDLGSEGKYLGEIDLEIFRGVKPNDVTNNYRKIEYLQGRIDYYQQKTKGKPVEEFYQDQPNILKNLERYQSELKSEQAVIDSNMSTIYWHLTALGDDIQTDKEIEEAVARALIGVSY